MATWCFLCILTSPPLCDSMYRKRLRGYASIGYGIPKSSDKNELPKQELIYDGRTFSEPFRQDLLATKHSNILSEDKVQIHPSVIISVKRPYG